MNPFQIIFLILILIIFFTVTRSKVLIFERVFTVIVILGGIVFLIYPNLTTRIANLVGIGRGADLIFYVFIIYGVFWFSVLSTRFRHGDRKLTKIVRALAISKPITGLRDDEEENLEVEGKGSRDTQ